METLFALAAAIIAVYLIYTCVYFDTIPKSISYTHYLWSTGIRYGQLVFPLVMIALCFLLVPYWLELTPERWQFLPFLGCAAMAFVGSAAAYLDTLTRVVHYTAAFIWAVASVVWLVIMSQYFALYFSVSICVMGAVASGKSKVTFWAELACVMALIIGIALQSAN